MLGGGLGVRGGLGVGGGGFIGDAEVDACSWD